MAKLRPDGGFNGLLGRMADDAAQAGTSIGNALMATTDPEYWKLFGEHAASLPSDLVRGLGTATIGAPADITPAMKKEVMEKGQPLYSIGAGAAAGMAMNQQDQQRR